jgi:hypothetical protein
MIFLFTSFHTPFDDRRCRRKQPSVLKALDVLARASSSSGNSVCT